MAVEKEVEMRILRKMVSLLIQREKIALAEVRRIIGNFSHDINEKTEDVAEVVGLIYKEATNEVFAPENFLKKGGH